MKLLRQIGIQFGVTFVALALLFTLGAPALQRFEGHPAIQKAIYTLGFAGEAYAITPDYEVDGNADDVQVQQALNALPVTGGKLVLYAGNWHFNATVSRAINNVTIEGDGKGTYLVNNGATALFSVGVQTGWMFKDFRTDAGWVTVSSAGDTLLAGNLWKGTSLISNVVVSGTTVPASPVKGQMFLQSTTGRTVLLQYDGSTWQVIQLYGDTTLYVSKTGTDDMNHGTGTGANAFLSISYTLPFARALRNSNFTTYIGSGNYTETLNFGGVTAGVSNSPTVSGPNYIGTPTTVASLTATGGGNASGASKAYITGAFVAGQYDGYLVHFTSGTDNNTYRVIGQTSTTRLWLNGLAMAGAPLNNDTYDILDPAGTTIIGQTAVGPNALVTFRQVHFKDTTGYAPFTVWAGSASWLYNSKVSALGSYYGVFVNMGVLDLIDTYLYTDGSYAYTHLIESNEAGTVGVTGGKLLNSGAKGSTEGVHSYQLGSVMLQGSEVSGLAIGVDSLVSSMVSLLSAYNTYIHGNTTGVSVSNMGNATGVSTVTYGKKLDNATADINTADQSQVTGFSAGTGSMISN